MSRTISPESLAIHRQAERRATWRDQGHKVPAPQRRPYGLVTAKQAHINDQSIRKACRHLALLIVGGLVLGLALAMCWQFQLN